MSWLDRITSKLSETLSDVGGRFAAFTENLNDRATQFLSGSSDEPTRITDLGSRDVRGPFATREEAESYASEIPLPTTVIFLDPESDTTESEDLELDEFPFFVEIDYDADTT